MASVNLAGLQDLEKLKDQIQPTSNQNFACTSVPPHWRCAKTLPDPFRVCRRLALAKLFQTCRGKCSNSLHCGRRSLPSSPFQTRRR
jgi:hypothetical protein